MHWCPLIDAKVIQQYLNATINSNAVEGQWCTENINPRSVSSLVEIELSVVLICTSYPQTAQIWTCFAVTMWILNTACLLYRLNQLTRS